MAEQHEQPEEIPNGITVDEKPLSHKAKWAHQEETLHAVLHRLLAMIFFPDPNSSAASTPLLQRIKLSVSENRLQLREGSKNTDRNVLLWTRRGSYLRAFLISVGTFPLLTLTGLFIFMLFFLAATVNAIVISLLMSLAAVGGFLALFFACVTAIYIGVLSVAAATIATATISAIVAVLIATGSYLSRNEEPKPFRSISGADQVWASCGAAIV